MLEYPKNYEEAKLIIKNSITDDYANHHFKMVKLRAAFITAVGVAAGIAVGAITKNPTWTWGILPNACLIGLSGLVPLLGRNVTKKLMSNDSYFNGKTNEEIMELATKYVTEYNEFERKMNEKKSL